MLTIHLLLTPTLALHPHLFLLGQYLISSLLLHSNKYIKETKMIQTINPYNTSKTAEIMSRYRPIAPKPQSPTNGETDENSSLPQGIRKSSYLRNVWAHLQARPTRTRKRGRTAAFSPPSVKRIRNCHHSPPPPLLTNPSMRTFVNEFSPQISLVTFECGGGLDSAVSTLAESVASLPILRCAATTNNNKKTVQELDFMAQLNEPVKKSVITPRAVRPIGSKIIVIDGVNEDTGKSGPVVMGAQDVENEVEAEKVPAVVSDSGNRVRFINSAYKEMIGQPECLWMDCVKAGGAVWRIGGEVVIRCGDEIVTMNGFNCGVKIEWENKRVDAVCEGVKLECESKDYKFVWRLYVNEQ